MKNLSNLVKRAQPICSPKCPIGKWKIEQIKQGVEQ